MKVTTLKIIRVLDWMEYGRALGMPIVAATEAAILQVYAPAFTAMLMDGDAFIKIVP